MKCIHLTIAAAGILGIAAEAADAVIIADLHDDFVPGAAAGDAAIFSAASGLGTWQGLTSTSFNPTVGATSLLEWDTVLEGYERPWDPHTNGFTETTFGPQTTDEEVVFHPASTTRIVSRFTAGADFANVRLTGSARKGDDGGGNGLTIGLFVDGTMLFSEALAFDDLTGFTFDEQLASLASGSTVDLVVDSNGSSFFDTTLVTFTIEQIEVIPLPAPAAMAGVGLLASLVARRRFRG